MTWFLNLPSQLQLILIAVVATFFAYVAKFAFAENKPPSFIGYLFGDSQSFAKAFVILVSSLFAALMTGVHNVDTIQALIAVGTGIGLSVPEKVDDHLVNLALKKQKGENSNGIGPDGDNHTEQGTGMQG